jgi:hypothetical protein
MEGFEHLSLIEDGLVKDPTLSNTLEQLRHHEATHTLFTNLPLEGAERQVWTRWCQNEMQFHINGIHHLGLVAQA